MKSSTSLLFSSLFLAAACASPGRAHLVDTGDQVLASRTAANGDKETFVLANDGGRDYELRRVVETTRTDVSLGVNTVEIDKAAAQERGVKPYSGLLIKSVVAGSVAAAAGLLPGDVLLAVGDEELVYQPQLREIVGGWQQGQEVRLAVLRGQERVERMARVVAIRREPVQEIHAIALQEPSYVLGPYAGVRLRGVPEPYNRELFGENGNGVVISYVEVGAPAWLAGLRAGDLVQAIDDGPVPAVDELARRIAERGEQRGEMKWQVTRGRGTSFGTTVALGDYTRTSDVHVPLVFHIDDGVASDRWAVGPFGLVMSSRTSYVAPTPTRQVETRSEFSALLGLFQVDSGPRDTEVRLLWIICFNT